MKTYERTKQAVLSDQPRRMWSEKKKVTKPFAIEHRYPKSSGILGRLFDGEWRIYSKYATSKQRDQALDQLNKNKNHGWRHLGEFRSRNL